MRGSSGLVHYASAPIDRELCSYLAYLANLDLTDANRPQSGAFTYSLFDRPLHFRFSLIRSLGATSYCLRILYQKVIKSRLSLFEYQNELFDSVMKKESGLILLSGPTGSGKTSSAYALLSSITDREIYTIEDPIELPLENAIQIQVNKKKGLTYGEGIKQLLRHDPDVILIGEIRDEEEAQMALRCALTGHLVLSTIHARNCIGAIYRMLDLGAREFDLFETLLLIGNQRLLTTEEKKGKVCLYETMDEEEIQYYRDHKCLSEHFISLSSQKKDLHLE